MERWRYEVDVQSAINSLQDLEPEQIDIKQARRTIAAALRRAKSSLPEHLAIRFEGLAQAMQRARTVAGVDRVLGWLYDMADEERIWLRAQPGPRDWIPKAPGSPPLHNPPELSGLQDVPIPSTWEKFHELVKEYEKEYASTHCQRGSYEEAYDFNIKIYHVNIPDLARQLYSPDEIQDRYNDKVQFELESFMKQLKERYGWISKIWTEGRSDGWLVVTAEEPAFVHFHSPKPPSAARSLREAKNRIRDLREIEEKIKVGIRQLKADFEDPDFWEIGPRDWSPRVKK